jgi:restriction system protein
MGRGSDFERKLARMFSRLGYAVEQTQASNDHGADLILRKRRRSIAVQAKSYGRPVGNKAVQEAFAAQAYYETDEAWVVTDSSFTNGALAQAEPCGVVLVDGVELRRMRRKARRKFWGPVVLLMLCAAVLVCAVIAPERRDAAVSFVSGALSARS